MDAPNFIELVRGRAWFKCMRNGCDKEFSFGTRDLAWLEHRGRPMPKYCRDCNFKITHPEEFEVQSPFFRFLPEIIQGAIMYRVHRNRTYAKKS